MLFYIFHDYEDYDGCSCPNRLMAVLETSKKPDIKDIPNILRTKCGYIISEKRTRGAMEDRYYILTQDEFNKSYVHALE